MIVAIILGNRMNNDGSISELCKIRCNLAKEMLDKKLADMLILSGGIANKTAGKSEAGAMFEYLLGLGVEKEKMIVENKSTTTVENAKFSVPMAMKYNPERIVICTTVEHMGRKYLNPIRIFKVALKSYPEVKLYAYAGE